MVSVIPFMLHRGTFYFKTKMPMMHVWRAIAGTVAIGCVTYSVVKLPLLKNTCIMFSEPLLFLPLAAIFLNEKVDAVRIICTLGGFLGIAIVTYQDFSQMNWWVLVALTSALFYAISNVIVKKMVNREHILTLLFYFGLGTSLLFLIPAICVWKPLTWSQIGILSLLGINGNIIQVFMFKSYAIADVSALMPIRYTEWIFIFLFGFFLFHQTPTIQVIIGGCIIIISSCIITLSENRRERRRV